MTHLSYFLYKYIFFFHYLVDNAWELGEIAFILVWVFMIRKWKISGQKTAIFGFILFLIMILCTLLNLDDATGLIAQYVFILFVISFAQEFWHFLKHENK